VDDECIFRGSFKSGRRRTLTASSAQSGFTLVETLMAMVVAASASIGLISALGAARQMAEEARMREEASRLANMLLIEAERGEMGALSTAGPTGQDGLRWTRSIRQQAASDRVSRIEVIVPWRAGRQTGSLDLVSYRWTQE
jgi:prepilin-type N-terminal cleavage/methylation domain-containing protein